MDDCRHHHHPILTLLLILGSLSVVFLSFLILVLLIVALARKIAGPEVSPFNPPVPLVPPPPPMMIGGNGFYHDPFEPPPSMNCMTIRRNRSVPRIADMAPGELWTRTHNGWCVEYVSVTDTTTNDGRVCAQPRCADHNHALG